MRPFFGSVIHSSLLVRKSVCNKFLGRFFSTPTKDVDTEAFLKEKDIKVFGFEPKYFEGKGFKGPTAIQSIGWSPVMEGRDFIGIAETGSGKTISFLVPAIAKLEKIKSEEGRFDGLPKVIIICPTRELAMQVDQEVSSFKKVLPFRSFCFYGGSSVGRNRESLSRGIEIVCGTPGRLCQLIEEGVLKMSSCDLIVMDEADRMLDMGFKKELDIILSSAPKNKQLIMWSATWPKDVSELASDYTKQPVRVVVGAEELTANKRIKQEFVFCSRDEKDQKLVEELKRIFYENDKTMPCTIVFANQKSKVAYLSERLSSAGLPSSCLHGDMSQSAREASMADFRKGNCKLLAATDVAARGIDMKDLKYVINYDFPMDFENYVHRIGRTARGADGVGTSISLLTSEDDRFFGNLNRLLEQCNQPIPEQIARHRSNSYSFHRGGGGGGGNRRFRSGFNGNYQNNYSRHSINDFFEGRGEESFQQRNNGGYNNNRAFNNGFGGGSGNSRNYNDRPAFGGSNRHQGRGSFGNRNNNNNNNEGYNDFMY